MSDESVEHLTPEAIAQQRFSHGRRGLAESDVRAFLERVARQVEDAQRRESELQTRLSSLEGQLAEQQRELDERSHAAVLGTQADGDALERLGEETTRVLRSAQDAAKDIRSRAEEHAERVRRDAEAEAASRAAEQLERATKEAESEIEAAKERGREMVNEARAVRERILADLAKRRGALHADIEELKAARERLVEAGTRVKRALAQATEAMVPFDLVAAVRFDPNEERAPIGDVDALLPDEASVEPAPTDAETEDADAEEGDDAPGAAASSSEDAEGDAGPTDGEEDGDIDALFARIREGREHAVDEARVELAPAPEGPAPDGEPGAAEPPPKAAGEEPDVGEEATEGPPPEPPAAADEATGGPHDDVLAARDEVLAPLERELAKRAKRVLQDEQNELLDAVRRRKGKVDAVDLLPALESQVDAWSIALASGLAEAYGAGRALTAPATARAGRVPQRLVASIAEGIVQPMRDRLSSSLAGAANDVEAATTRIGARYREFRVQLLEPAVGDALAAAYARGVYDSAPDDAVLEWVTPAEGQCPDCSDNALEPTRRGDRFPTGQELPPAHPGCRCTLAVAPAR